jgi:hypothetical protein
MLLFAANIDAAFSAERKLVHDGDWTSQTT